jgi:hypothetical protein
VGNDACFVEGLRDRWCFVMLFGEVDGKVRKTKNSARESAGSEGTNGADGSFVAFRVMVETCMTRNE